MTSESKKVLLLLISLTLVLVSGPSAIAANFANGKCPSAGDKTTINGAKYICTKSGKKLIWKKISAKPISKSTNQSSEDLKLETIFNGLAAKMNQVAPEFDLTVNVDPLLRNSKWSKDSVSSIGSATKLLTAIGIEKGQPMKIYLSWGPEYKNQFVPDFCKFAGGGGSCGQTGILFADLKWFAESWGYGTQEAPYKSEMDEVTITANLPHEIAHYAQTEAALAVGNTDYWMYIPPWLREGGAEYFKLLSSAYDNKRTYKSLHDLYVRNGTERCSKFPLAKITPQDSNSDGCEYGKGLLAVEYLVIKVGSPDALFMMQRTPGNDSASIFKKAFGFSLSEFEKEADDYFLRVTSKKD
jgi:hypothetical protein